MNNTSIITQIPHMDTARLQHYQQNLAFYQGSQWEGRMIRGEKRLTFNYAKTAIDKLTSYLMSSLTYAVDPVSDDEAAKKTAHQVEDILFRIHDENHLDMLDFDTEIDCAVMGDACYKVTWDVKEQRVRVTTPDVQGLYAWFVPDDVSRVYRVATRYQLSGEEINVLYGLNLAAKKAWVTEIWTDSAFELYIDAARLDARANPYGFIPFVIYPNLREPKQFWGISDIPVLMEPQKEINRALSQLSQILQLSGNPITVLENVESSEDIEVKPGAVWNLPESTKAYLLDLLQGGGVRLHVDYIELLYRALHDISESPRAAFGGTNRDLSGTALEIELHPLLQKVKRKRLIRTAAYIRRNQMMLALVSQFTGQTFPALNHRVVWGQALPQDLARQVTAEQILVQTGIHSRKRAMDELGIRNPELEFTQWLIEREQILAMNQANNAKFTRGGSRERALTSSGEAGNV